MRKNLIKRINIPEGTIISLGEDGLITVKGKSGENKRKFNLGSIICEIKGSELILRKDNMTKYDKKIMNSIAAHIKNMIRGANEKFVYELKVCFGHFPITVKQEGKKAIIKNFFGEKVNREVEIIDGAELEINKDKIIIKSVDKEIAGQTAANFEKATRIQNRDRRVFQDGIYIIKKDGKNI